MEDVYEILAKICHDTSREQGEFSSTIIALMSNFNDSVS